MVISRPKRYRDKLQAHYTTSKPIVEYMVSRLDPHADDRIWEPCAGNGDLLEGVLAVSPGANIRLSELDEKTFKYLDNKYRRVNIEVHQEDALTVGSNPLFDQNVSFSRIIANPPYGAYQSKQRRQHLQAQFPKLYVRESYGVILFHCLNLLDEDGRLVFIIPDTFLWLNRHEFLRRRIFKTTTIEEIALFPSKFFPKINFGYSGLCIISLTNVTPRSNHQFQLLTNFESVKALSLCVESCSKWKCKVSKLVQSEIASRKNYDLHIPNHSIHLSDRATEYLGDHTEIKTGFYSGNDLRWIRRKDSNVSRSKRYRDVDFNKVAISNPTLDGISGNRHFIPIIRGGASPYYKPTHWYVDWSLEAVMEYRRNGKNPARFQNSSYYFRNGIGVPMVASTKLTAALFEKRLFDQGIVGIFPKSSALMYYILGFLNSSVATKLIRQINPTANNSANYIKRLPFVVPNADELALINPLIKRAITLSREEQQLDNQLTKQIASFFDSIWLKPYKAAEQTDEPGPG